MKKIALLFIILCFATTAFANEYNQKLQALMQAPINCKMKLSNEQVTVMFWDGNCRNGFIDGSGMVMYKSRDDNYLGRYLGHFTENALERNTIWMAVVMTNYGKENDFVAKILNNGTTLYATWDKDPFFSGLRESPNWHKNTNYMSGEGKESYAPISYQDLLKELENDFNRLKPTMSFYKFKSYLEGNWNDGWSGPKLSTASNTNLQDDPPVAGISLSLGGEEPSQKTKKKSKKKI